MNSRTPIAAVLLSLLPFAAHAATTIPGPAGSVAFGKAVTVLPNGNIVVTDPDGPVSGVGAVYLYSPAGALISTLTGGSANDHIGSGGVRIVGDGHFVVVSPEWHNGVAADAGAVTWINGATGLNGVVSSANSLVGSAANDRVGINGTQAIIVLANGNYVVNSWAWSNAGVASAGAVTWSSGNAGVAGVVSAANSLVGTQFGDFVGGSGVVALTNGNYVVASLGWTNGSAAGAGAVTWANGDTGRIGPVSAANSLVGTKASDYVGDQVIALDNGNYVVASTRWKNGANAEAGAVTVGDGVAGRVGSVSAANSLVGSKADDQVGRYVTPLANGNFVVGSPDWDNGAIADAGAATWCNGVSGCAGTVSLANSLVGGTAGDSVGTNVVALANGNYVVPTSLWTNGAFARAGAATWGNGASGVSGLISAANSLVGNKTDDRVAVSGITVLRNGHYVVGSYLWRNGATSQAGAATWGNGDTGLVGTVSAANSLVGTSTGDKIGHTVVALENGHYVAASSFWNKGATQTAGAVTWGNGLGGTVGPVTASNSLTGSKAGDQIGARILALANGNYVVGSRYWDNGNVADAGAATWLRGTGPVSGTVSVKNSLVGVFANDAVGMSLRALPDGSYVVENREWDLAPQVTNSGAITLGGARHRTAGSLALWNSVFGSAMNAGTYLAYDYDPPDERLVVGNPTQNTVTLLVRDQLFADSFD